jgi:hypothetical protein
VIIIIIIIIVIISIAANPLASQASLTLTSTILRFTPLTLSGCAWTFEKGKGDEGKALPC